MTVTLEIGPELEELLRARASREGLPLDRYIVNVLLERLNGDWVGRGDLERSGSIPSQDPENAAARTRSTLPHAEAELLERINEGLPEPTWERYYDLKAKRDAETLTAEEHRELIALVNEIETWNARRLELVGELARLRGVSLSNLVEQLGLYPSSRA
jgi:hypothetical protein